MSLAAAFTIVVVPGAPMPVQATGPSTNPAVIPGVSTTVVLTPLLWLIACAAIILSYAYRPAPDSSRRAPNSPAPDVAAARRLMAKVNIFEQRRDYPRPVGAGSGRADSRVSPEK